MEDRSISHTIRECSSTLYVGMAQPAPPTNTNFFSTNPTSGGYLWRLTCIEHQIWSLPSLFWRSQFLATAKNCRFLQFIHHHNNNNQKVRKHSLCRVVTCGSAHKYKIQAVTQTGIPYTTLTGTEHHISSLHSHFWVQLSAGSSFLPPDKNRKFLWFFIINIIRECSSTLYVGMAHSALLTNTSFQINFLLSRLLEALYEDLPV